MSLEFWELLSHVVTVFGLLVAILVFLYEQRRERNNEEEEVYQELATNYQARRWASWEDYMVEWCQRRDFRACLPELLRGEDAEFGSHIMSLAARQSQHQPSR